MEVWKEVNVDFLKNKYEVSTFGNVRIKESKINISLRVGKRGYVVKMFKINKIRKTFSVHRLVAITFIENPENKYAVNHINGIKTDNTIDNLEWCSKSENEIHAHKIGLKAPTWLNKFGVNHTRSIPCVQYDLSGNKIKVFENQRQAAKENGIDYRIVNACIKGKRKNINNYTFKNEH